MVNVLLGIAPDTLEISILRCKSVDRVIGFTEGSNESREGIGLGCTSESALGIHISNVDLNRSMVLGVDQATSGRAFARNIKIDYLSLVVFHVVFRKEFAIFLGLRGPSMLTVQPSVGWTQAL